MTSATATRSSAYFTDAKYCAPSWNVPRNIMPSFRAKFLPGSEISWSKEGFEMSVVIWLEIVRAAELHRDPAAPLNLSNRRADRVAFPRQPLVFLAIPLEAIGVGFNTNQPLPLKVSNNLVLFPAEFSPARLILAATVKAKGEEGGSAPAAPRETEKLECSHVISLLQLASVTFTTGFFGVLGQRLIVISSGL